MPGKRLPSLLSPARLRFAAARARQYAALKVRDPSIRWWQLTPSNPAMSRYAEALMPARDPVLAEMEALGEERRFPLIGPEVGRLLHQLALMIGARRVFELGSGFGYSAVWFARALPEGGEVHCTDGDPANARLAEGLLARAGVAEKVRFHVGDALEALAAVPGEFDIVFNDVDKHAYPDVVRAALPRLRPGGLLISDNTLWHGRVLGGGADDAETRGVLDHNRLLFADDAAVFTTLLPLRDGVTVALKR
ncbi:O-methyltransferase [Myxococcota bacterium]|nr:O-methyltransferase [Myxococcota bacterium]